MKITIYAEDNIGNKKEITFSNDNFDNDNFIEMSVNKETFDISLDDLTAMINAFSHLRALREERDNKFK